MHFILQINRDKVQKGLTFLAMSFFISYFCRQKIEWRYIPSKNEEGQKAQIDLVIERGDRNINLCEMKFSMGLLPSRNHTPMMYAGGFNCSRRRRRFLTD